MTPREVLGPCIEHLEEAIEERARWVSRRGLLLFLQSVNTTAAVTTVFTSEVPPSVPTHDCKTKSSWRCCALAKLRTIRVVPATTQKSTSVENSTKVCSRVNPTDRVIANTDLTKNIRSFI
jgi:hypothetical protein